MSFVIWIKWPIYQHTPHQIDAGCVDMATTTYTSYPLYSFNWRVSPALRALFFRFSKFSGSRIHKHNNHCQVPFWCRCGSCWLIMGWLMREMTLKLAKMIYGKLICDVEIVKKNVQIGAAGYQEHHSAATSFQDKAKVLRHILFVLLRNLSSDLTNTISGKNGRRRPRAQAKQRSPVLFLEASHFFYWSFLPNLKTDSSIRQKVYVSKLLLLLDYQCGNSWRCSCEEARLFMIRNHQHSRTDFHQSRSKTGDCHCLQCIFHPRISHIHYINDHWWPEWPRRHFVTNMSYFRESGQNLENLKKRALNLRLHFVLSSWAQLAGISGMTF